MKIAVVADHHYYADAEGNVYVPSVYGYEYWERYLSVFDEITVICRGNRGVKFDKEKMILASGAGVKFHFVQDFHGFKELLQHHNRVKKQVQAALADCDCTFVRVPSPLSTVAVNYLIAKKKIFACEVAADPAENYNTVPFSGIVQRLMARNCAKACINANGVTYVTREVLQRRYPSYAREKGTDAAHFETYYSNANIPERFFQTPKQYDKQRPESGLRFVHVANMIEGEGKGHYVCLQILQELQRKGVPGHITYVGDGPDISKLREYAEEIDVADKISFIGRLSDGDSLREAYLNAHIMLLPSKTEGLPRSVIEAMACGLVCICSDVGGIPELMEREDMFFWKDAAAMAERIAVLWNNWAEMKNRGDKNREKAKAYSAENLQCRRDDFYSKMKELCVRG